MQTNGQHAHNDHFVERTGFAEVRRGLNPRFGILLTSADPVLFVADGNFTIQLGNRRFATRNQPRIDAVASADQRVFGSVEDGSTTLIVQRFSFGHSCRTRRSQTTVVPSYFDFWKVDFLFFATSREYIFYHLGVRSTVGQQSGRTSLNAGRVA